MARYLNLQIPQSCHEDWNKMLPHQKGKFCLSCQKQVIDFTAMSDSEVVSYFRNYKGSTCGRFTSGQLGRDLLIPNKPIPWIRYFFQITLPAFLLSFKAAAQSKYRVLDTIQTISTKGQTKPIIIGDTIINNTRIIEGVVRDGSDHPIPYATIMIKGTNLGTAADAAGKFILKDVPVNSD